MHLLLLLIVSITLLELCPLYDPEGMMTSSYSVNGCSVRLGLDVVISELH